MPSVNRHQHQQQDTPFAIRESASSTGSGLSGKPPSANGGNLLSVGSIALHDNLRCDILRTPISYLGSKSLSPGQPSFSISRLTLMMKFVKIELDESDTKLRATVTPPSNGRLEYVDARIYLRDSMDPTDSEYFSEPLYLADALSGDKHFERIMKAGSALTTDLRRANQNREDFPKARPTGGFIVKEGCPPVVGQLGSSWVDTYDTASPLLPQRAVSQVQKKHNRTASTASGFSAFSAFSAPMEGFSEGSATCTTAHWECEPCGSGTGEIIFSLRPIHRCPTCSYRPLKSSHGAISRSNNTENATNFGKTLPNKTFKLVAHLLNMDNGEIPEEFFAHFRVVFYFTDDPSKDSACCSLREHVFKASIKIGREGDKQLQQKKAEDFNDALARLEGKIESPEASTSRSRRPKGKLAKA